MIGRGAAAGKPHPTQPGIGTRREPVNLSSLVEGLTTTNPSSESGPCPNHPACSKGPPSTADTLIVSLNVNCGYSYSNSLIKSFAPGAPVSLGLTVTIKHGSCNGTYSKGSESTTFSLSA